MKKTEIIVAGIAILAIIMKFTHLPGAGILLVLSLGVLSMLYMYLGFAFFNNIKFKEIFKKKSYVDTNKKRLIGAIGTGFTLSMAVVGILFKIQLYPGAETQLMVGIGGLIIVSIISIIKMLKKSEKFYKSILIRVVIFGAICVFFISLPTKTWLSWRYLDNPEYVQAVLDAQENPDNPELWKKVDDEREKMYKIDKENL